MHKIKTASTSLSALLMALLFTVSVPVYAQHGSDDSGSGTSGSSSSSTTESEHSGSNKVATTVKTEDDGAVETEAVNDDSGHHSELRQRGAQLVAELKQEHKSSKSAEEKQKTCEAHKHGLTTKFGRLDTNAQRIQDRIDSIFQKSQDYQTANNVSGVDDLVTAAKTAQTNSAAAITQMKAVTPSLDCNSTSVASDVATFKVAAKTTRDNLKAYRDAVRAVLKAEAAAKHDTTTTTTNTTEGSDQ